MRAQVSHHICSIWFDNQQDITSKYITELRDRILQAYEFATASANYARAQQKDYYDYRVRGGTVNDGDRVLVKIVIFTGKLADR